MTDASPIPALQIRPAQVGESHTLNDLAMESKAHWNYTREQLELWRGELTVPPDMIAAGQVHVGVLDGAIVAMMALRPAPMTWKLDYFFVSPLHMHEGIGKIMFDHAVQHAQRGGARAVAIDADPNAERFYLSCGAVRSYAKAAPIADDSTRIRPQMLYLIAKKKD